MGHTVLNILRNVIVPKKEYFEWKIIGCRAKLTGAIVERDVAFAKQPDRRLAQPS
jgi:hypothetical protein